MSPPSCIVSGWFGGVARDWRMRAGNRPRQLRLVQKVSVLHALPATAEEACIPVPQARPVPRKLGQCSANLGELLRPPGPPWRYTRIAASASRRGPESPVGTTTPPYLESCVVRPLEEGAKPAEWTCDELEAINMTTQTHQKDFALRTDRVASWAAWASARLPRKGDQHRYAVARRAPLLEGAANRGSDKPVARVELRNVTPVDATLCRTGPTCPPRKGHERVEQLAQVLARTVESIVPTSAAPHLFLALAQRRIVKVGTIPIPAEQKRAHRCTCPCSSESRASTPASTVGQTRDPCAQPPHGAPPHRAQTAKQGPDNDARW